MQDYLLLQFPDSIIPALILGLAIGGYYCFNFALTLAAYCLAEERGILRGIKVALIFNLGRILTSLLFTLQILWLGWYLLPPNYLTFGVKLHAILLFLLAFKVIGFISFRRTLTSPIFYFFWGGMCGIIWSEKFITTFLTLGIHYLHYPGFTKLLFAISLFVGTTALPILIFTLIGVKLGSLSLKKSLHRSLAALFLFVYAILQLFYSTKFF